MITKREWAAARETNMARLEAKIAALRLQLEDAEEAYAIVRDETWQDVLDGAADQEYQRRKDNDAGG